MNLRTVAQWSLAVAVLIGMTWSSRENVRRLEAKVVYQRSLINDLRGEVRDMRGEVTDSLRSLREEVRKIPGGVNVNTEVGRDDRSD